MKNLLSIFIPVKDEEINVNIISDEIINKIAHQNYEIVFVNDYSTDNTENELIKLKSLNNKIVYYNNLKKGLGVPSILVLNNLKESMFA